MMELLVLTRCDARRQRLDALALPRRQQPPQVHRCPPPPRRMAERRHEWPQPLLEPALPCACSSTCHTEPAAGTGPRTQPATRSGEVVLIQQGELP